MSLGSFLVLLGLILAVVSLFSERAGRFGGYLLPVSVVLVALGVLFGAGAVIEV